MDTIFGASGTGVTVLGEYYPTVTSPQHPTQNDISVHVQSDGYDVIFAVAPINAVSITVGTGSAQSIAANLFVEDTDSNSPTYQAYVYSASATLSDGEAVAVVYNDGTSDITKSESYDATPPNVVSSSDWGALSLGVSLDNSADYAIVPETGGTTFKAIKGTYDLGTFTAAGAGDVSNISKSDVDTIFGASGTGVTVLGEYYPTVTSPQHPTQNDISVHVQSDGYDVIFAVAPINAVSITVGTGSAQSIAANLFVEDTDSNSPTYQAYVYSASATLSDGEAVAVVYNDGTSDITNDAKAPRRSSIWCRLG